MRSTIDQVTKPEALRCPDLHDFSDIPEIRARNWPAIIVLVIAAALTCGHFISHQEQSLPAEAALSHNADSTRG